MSLNDQKALSRRALEMWASGNAVSPDEIFAGNYVNHQAPSVEGGVRALSLAQWKDLVRGYHESFSNSKVAILLQIAEGDLVATRWQFTATQTGEFMGLAPTDKDVTWTGVQTDRFENAKIAESWVDWDMYSFFAALGLVKGP